MKTNNFLKKRILTWYIENGVYTSLYSLPCSEPYKNNFHSKVTSYNKNKIDSSKKEIDSFQEKKNTVEHIYSNTLADLKEEIKNTNSCSLKKTAKNFVFGDGNPESDVMLLGEAPGEEEDKSGVPFVGQAGKLLDKMLAAIGQNRKNTYLSNIIFWRPPGNRNPTDEEINLCLPYVYKHIEIVRPKILILAGSIAAKAILNDHSQGITQLRGKWQNVKISNSNNLLPAMPIFHPAFLLRQPARKREAWEDLKNIKKAIDML